MISPHSSWPRWRLLSRESDHSTEVESRLTRLEVAQEGQEEWNVAQSSRLAWLERGLQALAVLVLTLLYWQAPEKASLLADIALAVIKR